MHTPVVKLLASLFGLLIVFCAAPVRGASVMVDASCPGSIPILGPVFTLTTNSAGNVSCPEGTFNNATGAPILGFSLTTNTAGPMTVGQITCTTTIFATCTVSNNGPVYSFLFGGPITRGTAPVVAPGVPPGSDFHITISGFQPNELFQGQIIPEPATWLLLSSALLAFGGIRRRRNG